MAVELRILKTVNFGNAKKGRCFICQKPHSECGGPFLSTGVSAEGDEEHGADMIVIGQRCWKRMAKKMNYVDGEVHELAVSEWKLLADELEGVIAERDRLRDIIQRIQIVQEEAASVEE